MPLFTIFTVAATCLALIRMPGISEPHARMIVEDSIVVMWIILFFFYSDKLLYLVLSRSRFDRIRKRLYYFLNENNFFLAFIVTLILGSVIAMMVEMMLPPVSKALPVMRAVDNVVLIIFLIEFYLRFIAADENKTAHFAKAETLVDLLALSPLIRIFRLIRFLRLFRFLRVAKFRRYFQAISDGMTVLATLWSENVFYFIIIVILCVVILIFGTVMHYNIERGNGGPVSGFIDALWWSACLLFSGQPVDIPRPVGRLVGFIIMISGILITSILTGTVTATLSERISLMKGGNIRFNFRGHILICGWRESGGELIQYLHQQMGRRRRHVIIVDDTIDELPHVERDVYFVKGDPSSEHVLERANANEASAAIILSGEEEGLLGDQRTILATLAVESIARSKSRRDIHTCAEITNPANIKNLERAFVNEIILMDEYYRDILAQSAIVPGLIDFLNELLTNEKGENNLLKIRGEEFAGRSFKEVYDSLCEKNIIPIGVLREEKKLDSNGKPMLDEMGIPEVSHTSYINPVNPDSFELTPRDQIFVISRPDFVRGWEVVIE